MDQIALGLILGLAIGLMFGAIIGLAIGFSFAPDVTKLEEEISQLESTVSNLENSIIQKNQQIDLLQGDILSKGTEINDLQNKIMTRDNQIVDLQIELNNKGDEISRLQGQISNLESQMKELLTMMIEVSALTDNEYYDSVRNDLQNANDTIMVAMYSIVFDPQNSSDWGSILINELVNAKNREVNVTVLIEYKTYTDYMEDNLEAHNYLKQNGVTVILDSISDTDHMKLVIIDDKIVYIGSHNWDESGLQYNNEASVRIVSEELARIFTQYLQTA